MDVWQKRNHYDLLEIPRRATRDEITRAYRLQQAAWHPDRFNSADFKAIASKRSQAISAAYATLFDARQRQIYDQSLPPEDADDADVFLEPLQNQPSVWKRMAAWMKDEDVGTSFERKMAFVAGDCLERNRQISEKQMPYMLSAWNAAMNAGFEA